jgi:nucleoside-diphosphate-sugar epimerase
VFASSNQVCGSFERVPPYNDICAGRYDQVPADFPMITHEQIRPASLYGASKAWGEALGRHYVDTYDISIICVRIGSVRQEDKPTTVRENSVYLSHRDTCQALQKSIDAPESVKYDVFFAISNNRWNYRDLTHSKEVIGFDPQDSADDFPFQA